MTPLFIAEIGGNHGGSLKTALKTVDAAKEAGADYVKFQTWEADTMAIPGYIIPSGPWAGRELLDLYRETSTPWHWHPQLFDHARDIGIIPFSTPFDIASVALLEGLDCPMYKVASLEIGDTGLLDVIAATKKPVIVSTGAASYTEVTDALAALRLSSVTLLHCVSAYPLELPDANLGRMRWLAGYDYSVDVGLSDHSRGSLVAITATALGAAVIEKHFILDRSMGTPDAAFSAEPSEFKKMVEGCRLVTQMLCASATDVEASSRQLKRTLYYAVDLKKGSLIRQSHLKTARPALGLCPAFRYRILNKSLTADVVANQPVSLDDVT